MGENGHGDGAARSSLTIRLGLAATGLSDLRDMSVLGTTRGSHHGQSDATEQGPTKHKHMVKALGGVDLRLALYQCRSISLAGGLSGLDVDEQTVGPCNGFGRSHEPRRRRRRALSP